MNEKCFAKKTVPSRSGDCICLDGNCPGYAHNVTNIATKASRGKKPVI